MKLFLSFVTESECADGMAKCGNQVQCIYAPFFCDGVAHCSNGSDEDSDICTEGKYCFLPKS